MADICPIANLDNILLATDGSEFSQGAVDGAISLAQSCSSRLVAMGVVEVNDEFASEAPQLVEKQEQELKGYLDSIKAGADEAGVNCELVTHEGELAWRFIVDEAVNQKAELIVMGRRGRTGLAKMAMGSVTAHVIGHAPCGVMVVPRGASTACQNILVATDGSEHSANAIDEAIAMARNCGGSITVISVVPSEDGLPGAEELVKAVSDRAAAEGITASVRTPVGKAYQQIVATAQDEGLDLIVMGTRGRTGIAKLLMGSVADRVVGLATCAVLVAPSAVD